MPAFTRKAPKRQTITRQHAGIRTLTASASRVNLNDRLSVKRFVSTRQSWQEEAWQYRREIGELKYACSYLSNCIMRMRLFPAAYLPGGATPVDATHAPGLPPDLVQAAKDTLARLAGDSPFALGMLLKKQTENFEVAGECYLVGTVDALAIENWGIYSISEMVWDLSGRVGIRLIPGGGMNSEEVKWLLPESSYITRLWWPDPQYGQMADSPVRAALGLCYELQLLSMDVRATAKSRLANNGMLLIPEGLSIVGPNSADETTLEGDPFMRTLVEAAVLAIQDEGSAAAVVPILVRGPAEALAAIKHMNLDRPADKQNSDKRKELITRIATTLDLPAEILTGMADINHWCLLDNETRPRTEILTTNGWKTQDRLRIGDTALTLNHQTGMSEWQPVTDIYRADVVDEPMIEMCGRNHHSITTPSHRWPVVSRSGVRKIRTTDQLTETDRVTTGAPHAQLPIEAKWSDDLVELVAWFWTEGNVRRSERGRSAVMISQSSVVNPGNEARIRALITRLFGPASDTLMGTQGVSRWREKSQLGGGQLHSAVTLFYLNASASEVLLEIAPDRVVSLDWIRELTAAQLELFIRISMLGDGQHRFGRDITQRKSERLDAIELAAILSGWMTVRAPFMSGAGGGPDRTEPVEHWRLSLWDQTQIAPVKAAAIGSRSTITRDLHDGVVWCPVTPNGTWLARCDGKVYYTGNSAWATDDRMFRAHVEPTTQVLIDALTAGYLWPMLTAYKRWSPELVRRICIWYDPTELVTHPDRSVDAKDAFDRGAIGRSALRDFLGMGTLDKPDDLDEVLYVLGKAARVDPLLLTSVLKSLKQTSIPIPDASVAAQQATIVESTAKIREADAESRINPIPKPPAIAPPTGGAGAPADLNAAGGAAGGAVGKPPDMVRRIGNARANSNLKNLTAAADPNAPVAPPSGYSDHTGTMVALYPHPDDAGQIALSDPDAEPANELHVTLAYLPDLPAEQVPDLHRVVDQFAASCDGPIEGKLGGKGEFNPSGTSDDKPVTYGSIDAPGLTDMRTHLAEHLASNGFDVADNHGFTPHMTLAYGSKPKLKVVDHPLRFGHITVTSGQDRTSFPMGAANLAASVTFVGGLPEDGGPHAAADGYRFLLANAGRPIARTLQMGVERWSNDGYDAIRQASQQMVASAHPPSGAHQWAASAMLSYIHQGRTKTSKPLYRGVTVDGEADQVVEQFPLGCKVQTQLSSWTQDPGVAAIYATDPYGLGTGPGTDRVAVQITLEPGARTLPTAAFTRLEAAPQREHITAGQFEITSAGVDSQGTVQVGMKQIEVF